MKEGEAMDCPACHRTLRLITVGDVSVDICSSGCGGMWFDIGEFKKFDEPNEAAAELLDIPRDPNVEVDQSQRYRCTKCTDSVMMRHFASAKRAVVVDECAVCGGVWLDPGELRRIRSEYPSEEARRQAARAYFQEVLGDKIEAKRLDTAEKTALWQRVANILKTPVPRI